MGTAASIPIDDKDKIALTRNLEEKLVELKNHGKSEVEVFEEMYR